MNSIGAREAKNAFGRMLDDAMREPITIEKHGRTVAVVLSIDEYKRLEKLEDVCWAVLAEDAITNADWLSVEESKQVMDDIMNKRKKPGKRKNAEVAELKKALG